MGDSGLPCPCDLRRRFDTFFDMCSSNPKLSRTRVSILQDSPCSAAPGARALATNDIEKRTDQHKWNKREQIAPGSVKEWVVGFRPVIKRGVDAIECARKKCDDNSGN